MLLDIETAGIICCLLLMSYKLHFFQIYYVLTFFYLIEPFSLSFFPLILLFKQKIVFMEVPCQLIYCMLYKLGNSDDE